MQVYKRLLSYLHPYRWKLIIGLICLAGVAALTTCLAALVQPMIDDIFISKDSRMLVVIVIVFALVFLTKGACDFGQYYLMSYIGQSVIRDLRNEMFSKLETMSVGFFVRHSTGELLSRMTNDVALVQGAVTNAIVGIVRDALLVLGLLCLIFYRDFKLALIAVLVFPIAVYPLLSFGQRMKRYSRRMLVTLEDITQRLNETITGIRIVKAFAMEDYEKARFNEVNQTLFNAFMKRFKVRALSNPVMDTLGGLGVCAILAYGGYQVVSGDLTPGTFFSFVAALYMLYEPIKRINEVNLTIQEGVAAGERMFGLMDAPPDVADQPDATTLSAVRGDILFEEVCFSYDETPVLKNVTVRIQAGEVIAVVGESGVGKSSLLDLLPRFYDVTSGRILVDGVDIRTVTQRSLRENIGIVTQQTILFDDTIRNNIAYGRPELPLESVISAAKAADAHDFISTLPMGYDTVIGEDGIKLSGGERQRIAIARALLKNPPILILDEATSNLDSDSETAVQRALEVLMKGRTTLMVAHRLSTIRNADRIYVLVDGKVAEQGSHDELLARNGEFARLHRLQFAPEAASDRPSVASSHAM